MLNTPLDLGSTCTLTECTRVHRTSAEGAESKLGSGWSIRSVARDILSRCEALIVYLTSSRDVVVPRWNADEIALHARSTHVVIIDGPHIAW